MSTNREAARQMEIQSIVDFIDIVVNDAQQSEGGRIVLSIIVILVSSIILHIFAGWFGRRIVTFSNIVDRHVTIDEQKQKDTVRNIVVALLRTAIWLIAFIFLLDAFHINLGAIAAGAGFLGLVIGIGAQTTIRDILAGFFILFEQQYRVGDIVTLSGGAAGNGTSGKGTSGTVEEITLRITKLRGLDGTLSTVRNGEAAIITNRTINYARVVIDVGVAYDTDIDKVEKVMNDVGVAMMEDEELASSVSEIIHFSRVVDFLDSSVTIRAIGEVLPAKQWEVEGAYRRRLLKAFKKAGIVIPFPQVDVHTNK